MKCSLCPYTTHFPSWLKRHSLVHTRSRDFACDECGNQFRTVSELNTHRKLHAGEFNTCAVCGFKSRLKKVLDTHLLVHEEEKRIQCPECTFCCKRRSDLKSHMMSMHSGKPRRKRFEEDCCVILADMGVPFQREVVVQFSTEAARKFARVDFFWQTHFGAIVFEVYEMHTCGPRDTNWHMNANGWRS